MLKGNGSVGLQWIRVDDYEAMSRDGVSRIAVALEKRLRQGGPALLGLATGNTMLTLYQCLAEMLNERRLDLSGLHTFNLDEYVGSDGRWIPESHPLSYRAYMTENFFRRLDPDLGMSPDHIHFPDPADPVAFDETIRTLGGLDLQLLGIGFNGHVAFNEPMSAAEISAKGFAALPTRVVDLEDLTMQTNARLTADGDLSKVPRRAVTLGMDMILSAKEILLLACFPEQREPLLRIKSGRATPEVPASCLIDHPDSTIIYTSDTLCLEQ